MVSTILVLTHPLEIMLGKVFEIDEIADQVCNNNSDVRFLSHIPLRLAQKMKDNIPLVRADELLMCLEARLAQRFGKSTRISYHLSEMSAGFFAVEPFEIAHRQVGD